MKTNLLIGISIFIILFSCKKENEDYNPYPNNYPVINIDTVAFTYLGNNLTHYFTDNFNSTKHIAKFNVKLLKDRFYRFYTCQQYSNQQNIALSLVNNAGDTICTSKNTSKEQVLLFNSTSNNNLILQAQLINNNNLSLDYRIFFEERRYPSFTYNNIDWQSYGNFKKTQDSIVFKPSLSMRNRWLMINKPINDIKSIEYQLGVLNSNQLNNISLAIADKMTSDNFSEDLLQSDGYYYKNSDVYQSFWQISNSDSSTIAAAPSNLELNQSQFNVKIENNSDNVSIYINQNLMLSFNYNFEDKFLYILFDDRFDKEISIKNTKVINN